MRALLQEFTNLSTLLDVVIGSLPSMDPQVMVRIQNAEQVWRLCVTYTILSVATIGLNSPFAFSGRSDSSTRKWIASARTVLEIIIAVRSRGTGYLNPIVGVCERVSISECSC